MAQHGTEAGQGEARPDIVRLVWASERIALVEVSWSLLDAGGNELAEEVATYTIRRDDGGQLKAWALVAHGKPPSH